MNLEVARCCKYCSLLEPINVEDSIQSLPSFWFLPHTATPSSDTSSFSASEDRLEQGVSIRAYCLCAWRHASVEGIAALEDAFNNCIEAGRAA